MMGLILGIVVAVATILIAGLTVFANGMSDAPSMQDISPVPTLIVGGLIAGVLILSHFYVVPW